MKWSSSGGNLAPFRRLMALVTLLLLGANIFLAFRGQQMDETYRRIEGHGFPEHIYFRNSTAANHTIQLPPFSPQESFGACALVLNQNHRMTEWIAYHYFALPMRTLIIAYDPKCTQRATDLLHRWKDVIDVIEWEEDDYLPADWLEDIRENYRPASPLDKPIERVIHEHRQIYFMQQCTLTLADKNISRVIHHDVDEYLRVNTNLVKGYDTTRPGHITEFLNQKSFTKIPSGWSWDSGCWVLLRLFFTPVFEDSPGHRQSLYKHINFPWFQPTHFDTLRYRWRKTLAQKTAKGILQLNNLPSTVLSRRENFFDKWMKVHNPLGRPLCEGPWPVIASPLILNHYLGSYEAYLYASQWDFRFQNLTDWERRTTRGKGKSRVDDGITNWVQAFIAWQSEPVARQLLSDAGLKDEILQLLPK
ncbi:hypothetical protein FisN_16Hh149 [Fistulifera solaris]|uniref:Uncharacterized protein n=1 Tax=Fistulifera solaris TaxID=1519565 RepID=A0A1Z5KTQ1_FISSO|nr:hypothetical protein FisN_16Hh149 [Fistulifera solaris]|eukprot:GAX29411.1 hypothetical protein FisN_16Hh149 [Fistulifera solaris]